MPDELKNEVIALANQRSKVVCRVKFTNDCPPEWNVTITQILAGFTYSDGSTSTDKNDDVRIGDPRYLYSHDKCVKKAYMHAVWEYPGGSDSGGVDSDEAPAGQCWSELGFVLGPARLVPEGNRESRPIRVFLAR